MTSSRSHSTKPFMTPAAQAAETNAQARNAFRINILYFAANAAGVIAFGVYLAGRGWTWQLFAVALLSAVLGGVNLVSAWLTRRGRHQLGIQLVIGVSTAAVIISPLLVSGFGLIAGLAVTLTNLMITTQVLPQKAVNRVLIISIAAGLAAGALDLLSPPTQLVIPTAQIALTIIGAVLLLVFALFITLQFRSFPLSTKLIILFLAVSLVPVGLVSYSNFQSSRAALQNSANQTLSTAARQTAAVVDNFINTTTASLRVDAQGPVLVSYMALSPEARQTSDLRVQVGETLRTLSSHDPLYISSYALLDTTGVDLADTYARDIGQNKSDRDYFQNPVATRLAYVSPVEISPSTGRPSIYFSAPVQSFLGVTLGVLRVRYDAGVLQGLIASNSELAGQGSVAILLDENYIRLAHSANTGLLFKAVTPLDELTVARLQAARRLPDLPLDQLATNLPDLARGLDRAAEQPLFSGELDALPGENQVDLGAVARLEHQPWYVVYARPEAVALAPVNAQSRALLLGSLVIAGLVALAAVSTSQLLAGPITRLTAVAERIRGGELTATAPVEGGDEIGLLAGTFNAMTQQLRDTQQGLEQRVADRTKALAASAEVSRRLSTIMDQRQLLREVVDQVQKAFNFYHAHIYLFDDRRENLVMAGGTGEAGATMLARGHSLARGRGLVGRAAETNTVVLVPDVTQAAGWLPNPLLSETRAEVAVPIAIGDTVLGVLDVQHNILGGLKSEDADLLRSIADQVAVALENSRLYRQAQRQAQNESLVNVIGQKIQRAATVEEAMQVAIRELGTALNARRTTVQLSLDSKHGDGHE